MPRPHKPIELLTLDGGYRADRHGQRRAAPKSPHPIGDPPACLAPDEAAAWREFVRDLPPGVLTSGDRVALEATARLVGRSRREGLSGAELGHLRAFLSELGATPASRGQVLPAGAAAEPAGGNPWDVAAPGRA
jgi:phage terminase small subunit